MCIIDPCSGCFSRRCVEMFCDAFCRIRRIPLLCESLAATVRTRGRGARATWLRGRPSASPARSAVLAARRRAPRRRTCFLQAELSIEHELFGAFRLFPPPRANAASYEGGDGCARSVRARSKGASVRVGACGLWISKSVSGSMSALAAHPFCPRSRTPHPTRARSRTTTRHSTRPLNARRACARARGDCTRGTCPHPWWRWPWTPTYTHTHTRPRRARPRHACAHCARMHARVHAGF